MLHITDISLLSGLYGFLYLDPGSGSVLLQVLLAILVGLGLAVRSQWSRIKGLFTARRKSDTPAEHEE